MNEELKYIEDQLLKLNSRLSYGDITRNELEGEIDGLIIEIKELKNKDNEK